MPLPSQVVRGLGCHGSCSMGGVGGRMGRRGLPPCTVPARALAGHTGLPVDNVVVNDEHRSGVLGRSWPRGRSQGSVRRGSWWLWLWHGGEEWLLKRDGPGARQQGVAGAMARRVGGLEAGRFLGLRRCAHVRRVGVIGKVGREGRAWGGWRGSPAGG